MRRVKTDVSHRIRRPPSIFGTLWFRGLMLVGLLAVIALTIGPWLFGWFAADLPRSAWRLSPWAGSDPKPPDLPSAAVSPPGSGGSLPLPAPAPPGPSASTVPPASTSVAVTAPDPSPPPAAVTRPAARSRARSPDTAPPAKSDGTLPYRIQVGAFVEPGNAERLVAKLRTEGFEASATLFEQSRMRYRVLLGGPEDGQDTAGAPPPDLQERLRSLGMTAELTRDGMAVTGYVPLRTAVETSKRLREAGVMVRLKQETGSSTYRVVRVGAYGTAEEAERSLAELVSRGYGGFVIRER